MIHVCDINVIDNNRYLAVGTVMMGDEFMFKSSLVTGLEYETIDKVPNRVLEGICADPYTNEFSIAPVSLEHIKDLKDAVMAEIVRRKTK